MAIDDIYTASLMEHSNHPDYRYELEGATCTHEGINPSCGDDITLSLRLEGGIIEEAAFLGHGCAVSQASTDIMADLITGRTAEEAASLCELFLGMVRGDISEDAKLKPLGEAAALRSISRMPARVKCAELAWRTCLAMLEDCDCPPQG